MAVMGLRLAAMSNGVSSLHGEVSREMFQPLWPDVPADEVPIGVGHQRRARPHVGVVARWTTCYSEYVVAGVGRGRAASDWARIDDARDDELWRVREQGREALVAFVRDRLRRVARRTGAMSRERRGLDRRRASTPGC